LSPLAAGPESPSTAKLPLFFAGHGPVSYETFGHDTVSNGARITSSASANTKGSYVELSAATGIDTDGFYFYVVAGSANADFLIDVAIGASGSEVDILSNLLCSSPSNNNEAPFEVYVPLPIPAGSRMACRCQSSDSGAFVTVCGVIARGGMFEAMRMSRATTYGANTSDSGGVSVDPGGTSETKGSYSEISAAITNPIRYAIICAGAQNNGVRTSMTHAVDIAYGGAGSETIIVPDINLRQIAASFDTIQPAWLPRFFDLDAGQRLAARQAASANDATDRLLDIAVVGFD
jgi:hypothetical protein